MLTTDLPYKDYLTKLQRNWDFILHTKSAPSFFLILILVNLNLGTIANTQLITGWTDSKNFNSEQKRRKNSKEIDSHWE